MELEPGVEALAHVSTFSPTGQAVGWTQSVPVGTIAPFEILSVDLAQKRIGVALMDEGSSRKAVAQQLEQAEVREYAARPDATSAPSLGSLADKLRDAFKAR